MAERTMMYKEPMDISNFLNLEMIAGYCHAMVREYQKICSRNKELQASPVYKNNEYKFYNIDYGFLVYVLVEYARSYFTELEDNPSEGDEVAKRIYADFALNDTQKLSTNGMYFLSILEYHKLAYKNKYEKGFYTKQLLLNPQNSSYYTINSLAFNVGSLNTITGNNNLEKPFLEENPTAKFMWLGYGKNANSMLKKADSSIKIFQFWERDTGFTGLLPS